MLRTRHRQWPTFLLPLILLMCFSACIGVGVFALSYLRAALVNEKGAELARAATRIADTLDRVLFERFGDIQTFGNDRSLLEGQADERRRRLRDFKDMYWYYSWIGITDATGRIVATTDSTTPAYDTGTKDWFRRVQQTRAVYQGYDHISLESEGVRAVGFSAPMFGPQGEFQGVVTSRIPFDNLRAIFEQEGKLQYGEAHDWVLLDLEGMVIIEKTAPVGMADSVAKIPHPAAANTRTDRSQAGFVEELHQRNHIPVVTGYARTKGYTSFPGFEWTVLVRLDRDQAYAPVNRLMWTVSLVGLLVIAPLGGFGVWASWRLIKESRILTGTQEQLRASVAELTRSNNDLQQFAYVASHDLQEPLRMVASYTQLIARRYKGKLDSDADEFIAFAVEGAKRMQCLITDLLTYSRVTTQARDFEPVDCQLLLQQVLENLRVAIEEKRAVITIGPMPAIMADGAQLMQLFQNLLMNAVKFCGLTAPAVQVSAERRSGEWLFSIRDNGIGIDPQYAERIFIIFQRLNTREEYPGTGIGLALCKKIVERHGGRIWVTSQVGQGATFYFTLPFGG
jgi:signal transduction histidine kinase